MIKVNLLAAAKREPARKAGPSLSMEGVGTLQNLLFVVLIVGTVGFLWWWWHGLNVTSAKLDEDIAQAQEQMKKVEEDRRVAAELEKKRQRVEQQINLITQLKNEQQVPVRLLDEISRNLPEFLWLTSLSESAGQLTFGGKATTPTAYANFYNNLDASPYFADVGRISYRDEGASGVSFSLAARFVANPQQKKPAASAESRTEGAQ